MSFSPMKSVSVLLFAIASANVILPQNSAFMLTTTRIHPRPSLIRFYSPHESEPSQANVLTSFIKTAGRQKKMNLSTTKQINPLSDHSSFKSVLTTSFLTFAIWNSTFALPLTLLSTYNYDDAQNTMYSCSDLTATISSVKNSNQPQYWTAVNVVETLFSPTNFMASAKELASGSGSRVNKDPESLLRYGLPIPNDKEIRQLQATIEDIRQDISSKRKLAAIDDVKKARQLCCNVP